MAQLDFLTCSPIEFDFESNRNRKNSSLVRTQQRDDSGNFSATALMSGIMSTSPSSARTFPSDFFGASSFPSTTEITAAAANVVLPDDVSVSPSLPPLHRGHPDLHLHNGIVAAAVAAADNDPDAERAFFVADLSQVFRQHERWQRCLPGVEPFYAVKCNPDPYVIRLLAGLGAGFDCASHGEIAQVLEQAGVGPDKIIFANPCKPLSFIRHAAKFGVKMMTFDNIDELYKIARIYPEAKLIVRILTDDSKSLCRLGLKFGAPLATVPGLLLKAKELGLDVIGVSFHVGSGCYDCSAFADAVHRARTAFDMGLEAGYKFTLLDVGGGFEDANFEQTASVLSAALVEHFPNRDEVRIIAEPGRYYVSAAFTLATNIIARRARLADDEEDECDPTQPLVDAEEDNEQPRIMYYINEGVYGSFNCIMFDHQTVTPYVLTLNKSFLSSTAARRAANQLESSSVWGPTCDSIDLVCPLTKLPRTLQVGDWLGFKNMGAYTICAASQFNGFAKSNVVYTSGTGRESAAVRRALGVL